MEPILQDQIRLRHILIKTNEILDDDAAKEKLKTIRDQIINDGDFGAIAAAVSEDAGSAQEGGDMGWTGSGFFVPEFEEVALAMENDEISEIDGSPKIGWDGTSNGQLLPKGTYVWKIYAKFINGPWNGVDGNNKKTGTVYLIR